MNTTLLQFNLKTNFNNPEVQETVDPDLLTIDEVAQRIFNRSPDNDLETLVQKERDFRKARPFPKEWDSYEPAGGLQWSMKLGQEIVPRLQQIFKDLRDSGILMFRSEYLRNENPAKFRSVGKIYNKGQKNGSLDRLWGAEYLRKKLEKNEQYRVPRFVLVLEDRIESLPISIYRGPRSLLIQSIEEDDGEILAENIVHGTADAWNPEHHWLRDLGYVDFSDPGNILLNKDDGKFYIVDTEWKSLKGVLPDLDREEQSISRLREYAIKRFKTFYPQFTQTFHIKKP